MRAWLHCGITVRGAWWKKDFREWRFPVSDHWLLFVLRTGALELKLPRGTFRAEQGQGLLLAPGFLYRVEFQEYSELLDLRFSVVPAVGSRIPFNMLPLPLCLPGPWEEALWQLPEGMSSGRESRWTSQHVAWQARKLVDDALFQALNRAFREQSLHTVQSPPGWLREAMQAAVHHIHDPDFGASAFARLAGCTPEHLTRSIQKTEQRSSSQYLRKLRIERAAHLLVQDPQLRSEELITRCGFRDMRQFRTHWKAETGQGLREFRRGLH